MKKLLVMPFYNSYWVRPFYMH